MDSVRKRLQRALDESGQDMKALSVGMKKNPTYLQQFLRRGSPKKLHEDDRRYLAQKLRIPEYELGGPRNSIVDSFDPDIVDEVVADEAPTIGSETGSRGIPDDSSAQIDVTAGMGGGGLTIISDGVPGKAGMTFAAEHIRDYWRLPPGILSALGLRASDVSIVMVQGDSMQPTLDEGDFVFIDTRHRWPSPDGLYALSDAFGGIVVKRIEVESAPSEDDMRIRVISDNIKHAPKSQTLEETRIIGRVLRRFGIVQ